MLETVREFGLERLEASGEARAERAAHARYVLDLVERVDAQIFSPEFGQAWHA